MSTSRPTTGPMQSRFIRTRETHCIRPVMVLAAGHVIDDTSRKTHPHSVGAAVDDTVGYQLHRDVYEKFKTIRCPHYGHGIPLTRVDRA